MTDRLKAKCVLAMRFSALGDVAMTIPPLYSACEAYPHTRFVMATKPAVISLFVNPPSNLKVVGIDMKKYAGLRGALRLFNLLHSQYEFDAVADLQSDSTTRWFRAICRLHGRIAMSRLDRGIRHQHELTRRNNKRMLPLANERARYREALYNLGLPVETTFTQLYAATGRPPYEAIAELTAPKQLGELWIGIAPFANYPGKMYPGKMMEEVINSLTSNESVRIFLFGGGESEQAIMNDWANRSRRIHSVAAKQSGFPTELALMSHLDVMLSMDSANMHLASLVDIPVVSIWGATHPYSGFYGWQQPDTSRIQLAMTCRPCSYLGDKPCRRGDYYCLRGIKPDMVVEKVLATAKRSGNQPPID